MAVANEAVIMYAKQIRTADHWRFEGPIAKVIKNCLWFANWQPFRWLMFIVIGVVIICVVDIIRIINISLLLLLSGEMIEKNPY